jgi:hypothetical protein
MGDRDSDIAPQERQEQHRKQIAAGDPDFGVGILEDSHLDQGDQQTHQKE